VHTAVRVAYKPVGIHEDKALWMIEHYAERIEHLLSCHYGVQTLAVLGKSKQLLGKELGWDRAFGIFLRRNISDFPVPNNKFSGNISFSTRRWYNVGVVSSPPMILNLFLSGISVRGCQSWFGLFKILMSARLRVKLLVLDSLDR
jgi:hypothetical protein